MKLSHDQKIAAVKNVNFHLAAALDYVSPLLSPEEERTEAFYCAQYLSDMILTILERSQEIDREMTDGTIK